MKTIQSSTLHRTLITSLILAAMLSLSACGSSSGGRDAFAGGQIGRAHV